MRSPGFGRRSGCGLRWWRRGSAQHSSGRDRGRWSGGCKRCSGIAGREDRRRRDRAVGLSGRHWPVSSRRRAWPANWRRKHNPGRDRSAAAPGNGPGRGLLDQDAGAELVEQKRPDHREEGEQEDTAEEASSKHGARPSRPAATRQPRLPLRRPAIMVAARGSQRMSELAAGQQHRGLAAAAVDHGRDLRGCRAGVSLADRS